MGHTHGHRTHVAAPPAALNAAEKRTAPWWVHNWLLGVSTVLMLLLLLVLTTRRARWRRAGEGGSGSGATEETPLKKLGSGARGAMREAGILEGRGETMMGSAGGSSDDSDGDAYGAVPPSQAQLKARRRGASSASACSFISSSSSSSSPSSSSLSSVVAAAEATEASASASATAASATAAAAAKNVVVEQQQEQPPQLAALAPALPVRETAVQAAQRLQTEAATERLRQIEVAVALLQGPPLHVVKHGRQGRPKPRLLFSIDHAKTLFWMPVPPSALRKSKGIPGGGESHGSVSAAAADGAEEYDGMAAGAAEGGVVLMPRDDRSIELADVTHVLRGRRTQNFLRTGAKSVRDDDRCISLVLHKRTLDMEFPRPAVRGADGDGESGSDSGPKGKGKKKKEGTIKRKSVEEPPRLSDEDFTDFFMGLSYLQEVASASRKPFGQPLGTAALQ